MTRRLVDIADVFDQTGFSMLSREHLENENAELRRQIARMKQLLMAQLRRQGVDPHERTTYTQH